MFIGLAPGNVLGHWSLGEAILSKKVQLRNQSKDVKEEGKKKVLGKWRINKMLQNVVGGGETKNYVFKMRARW